MSGTITEQDAPAVNVEIDVDAPASILPEGTSIPDRDSVTEAVLEAFRNGTELQNMVASDVLGLPTAIIQQARDENTFVAPAINSVYTESRNTINQPVSDGTHLTISGSGSRDVIKNALTPYFERNGLYGVVELTTGAGMPRVIENVPEGLMLVQIPNQVVMDTLRESGRITDDFDTVTIEGQSIQLIPASYRNMFVNSASWTTINLEGVELPVAAVKNDGRTIVMFAGIFTTETWNGWSRSERDLEAKTAAFEAILDACRNSLTNISVKPVSNPEFGQIREVVSLFESIKTLGIAHFDQFETRLTESKQKVTERQTAIETHRTALTTALLELREAEEAVHMYGADRTNRISEAIEQAFVSVRHLSGLRSIKNIEFQTDSSGRPKLRIETHDMAMQCHNSSGAAEPNRRLIKGLKFDVTIAGSNPTVQFDNTDVSTPSVHPHVNQSNSTICWGEAATPLAEAAGRRDWVTMINVIIRWAATYNWRSPYVEASNFPSTDLPAGWIIPAA